MNCFGSVYKKYTCSRKILNLINNKTGKTCNLKSVKFSSTFELIQIWENVTCQA